MPGPVGAAERQDVLKLVLIEAIFAFAAVLQKEERIAAGMSPPFSLRIMHPGAALEVLRRQLRSAVLSGDVHAPVPLRL